MTMEGGCFCGAVRYRISGEPLEVTHCHCRHCRKTSGAPFVTWVSFKAEEFTFTRGTPLEYESRPKVTRSCCPRCGTQLSYRHRDARTVDITAGSLDDPAGVEPQDHIWCDRMLPWIRLGDGLPRYARERDHQGSE